MEALLGLLAFAYVLGLPIGLIVALVGLSRLRRRVALAEATLRLVTVPQTAVSAEEPLPGIVSPWEQVAVEETTEAPKAGEIAEAASVAAHEPAPEPPAPLAEVPQTPVVADADQDRPIVLRRDRMAELAAWVKGNWVYLVSAASLAAAGVFFVQYGIEKGLLPPPVRVTLAILFGLALIGAGEWLRRRAVDPRQATLHLPAVFSGAGLVSIFAGIIAGRLLYGLYGPEVTFAGLVATAALAIGLGWRNEPFLVAVGLLGASVAPFLVGSDSATPAWLYGYYALIAVTGLAVDAVRRWAWISVLALVLGYGFGYLLMLADGGIPGWIAQLVVLALAATVLPTFDIVPQHEGPAVLPWLLGKEKRPWPNFPVRLAAGAVLVSSFAIAASRAETPAEAWIALGAMAALTLAYLVWADRAPGLDDLALVPAIGFGLRVMGEGTTGPLGESFAAQAIWLRPPETSAPWTVTILVALTALISLGAFLRAVTAGRFGIAYGLGAILPLPLVLFGLDQLWHPSEVLGAYVWALHVMAGAALMVVFALRFAARDGEDHRRPAYATIAALVLIALALFLVTSGEALTLALAVLVLATAVLDRRFDLRELAVLVQVGVAVLGWRITIDPGADWALTAGLFSVLAVYGGVILAVAAALFLLLPLPRAMAKGVLESGVAGFSALFANVLIARALGYTSLTDWSGEALDLTLNAMPWLILMLVQLYRMPLGGPLRRVRGALAALGGLIAALGLLGAAVPANPLLADGWLFKVQPVRGPLVFDTLMVTYLMPALLLLVAPRLVPHLPRILRRGFLVAGCALAALYAGLEIRRFWRGDILSVEGVTQPELYSYTLALMLTGAALLYQAIARRSPMLRRIAMTIIALTIAKVFLIDASGLTGLTRVFSFLGLGLSLAGLAWLNRWAGAQSGETGQKTE